MTTLSNISFGPAAEVTIYGIAPEVLVLCEHASNYVPEALGDLGLSEEVLQSHVAWDPGARPVADRLAERLEACSVNGTISRLVYDCNRPPEAPSAMPARSEVHDIPGNRDLSQAARRERIEGVYQPFRRSVQEQLSQYRRSLRLLVTVHSFTPTFHGQPRAVELGVLHGADARFAHAMMAHQPSEMPYQVALNAPYSAADGVAHSLDTYGKAAGLQNVMIELRNDLIATPQDQARAADLLAEWITATARAEGVLA